MEHEGALPEGLLQRIQDAAEFARLFPVGFDFYGHWEVKLLRRACELSECAASPFLVAFQVMGDRHGACVVAFDRSPASEEIRSAWLELANVLAGKFVTQLAERGARDAMLSPPDVSESEATGRRHLRAALLAGGTPGSVSRLYELKGERAFTLRMAFLPAPERGGTS